jgi:hypothetical protein
MVTDWPSWAPICAMVLMGEDINFRCVRHATCGSQKLEVRSQIAGVKPMRLALEINFFNLTSDL